MAPAAETPATRAVSTVVAGREFLLHRPVRSLDELVDEMVDGPEPELPYWAHLWPTAVALAERLLAEAPLRGRALELGCGIGLVGLAAVAAGMTVTQTDKSPAALEIAGRSAAASGLGPVEQHPLDWNDPPPAGGPYELVIGADILYERAFCEPLLALLPALVAPEGRALIADPCRSTAAPFVEGAARAFRVQTSTVSARVDGQRVAVAIHELRPRRAGGRAPQVGS